MALAMGLIAIGTMAAPAAAENACIQANPQQVSNVQGYTWLGTVTYFQHRAVGTYGTVFTFTIDHVYAGSSPRLAVGNKVTFRSGQCMRITRLHPGVQYLFSTPHFTRDLHHSDAFGAWQIDGDAAHFVVMHPDPNLRQPTLFEAATTLDAALNLVALDAVLPPTSTVGPVPAAPPAPGPLGGWLPGLLGLLSAAGTALLLRRRLTVRAR